MREKKTRRAGIELLRIACMLFIISDHFVGQSGIRLFAYPDIIFYTAIGSLSRVACSVFVIISAWFSSDSTDFRLEKLGHIWLTAFEYAVPVTAFLYFTHRASGEELYMALLPVEGESLWFVSCFLLLQLLAPALKLLVRNRRRMTESLLIFFGILLTLYTTLTGRVGFFSNDFWALLFVYTLTLDLKIYHPSAPPAGKSAALFAVLWIFGVGFTVFVQLRGYSVWSSYAESCRVYMQTLPNLLLAYSLFFAFLGWERKSSRLLETLSACTLGVYCFHQIPAFYPILWADALKSYTHAALLSGGARMLYTLCAILLTALAGTLLELLRLRLSALLIENRAWYQKICRAVNNFVNEKDILS